MRRLKDLSKLGACWPLLASETGLRLASLAEKGQLLPIQCADLVI